MKVFKYKFSRLTTSLIYLGIVLCVLGLGFNTYSVIASDIISAANPVYPILQHTLMYLVPAVLLVILISLLISSYYQIDGKVLKSSFGIIKSKYAIDEIETVALDRTTNKLAVYFKNGNYIVIVVKEEWYQDFVDELCKANPKIEYTIKSKENDGSDDKIN